MPEMKLIAAYSLCPDCDHCPTVEAYQDEVRIGEEGNQVRLKAEEWNLLVQAIRQGEVKELDESDCNCTCDGGCDCGCGCCL